MPQLIDPGGCPVNVNALPIKWGAVSAIVNDNTLTVKWTTVSKSNNDHFNIEASKDGIHFKKLGEQKTLNKDGNSSAPTDYTFIISSTTTAALAGFTIALLFGGVFMYSRKKRLTGGMLYYAPCLLWEHAIKTPIR